jgi:hypothetical protein
MFYYVTIEAIPTVRWTPYGRAASSLQFNPPLASVVISF